jgi:hypothetical protein
VIHLTSKGAYGVPRAHAGLRRLGRTARRKQGERVVRGRDITAARGTSRTGPRRKAGCITQRPRKRNTLRLNSARSQLSWGLGGAPEVPDAASTTRQPRVSGSYPQRTSAPGSGPAGQPPAPRSSPPTRPSATDAACANTPSWGTSHPMRHTSGSATTEHSQRRRTVSKTTGKPQLRSAVHALLTGRREPFVDRGRL